MPVDYYVAWWNVENLFDEENAPLERRTDKVLRGDRVDAGQREGANRGGRYVAARGVNPDIWRSVTDDPPDVLQTHAVK